MKHPTATSELSSRRALELLAVVSFAAVGTGSALAQNQEPASQTGSSPTAAEAISDWPETSTEAAQAMMEKYGEPDGVTDSMLIWNDSGPWVRTIVYKEEVDHRFPMPHKDVLEQFVNYEVPEDKFSDLAEYDGSVVAYRTNGELSARCDKEAANFLAVNLAHDLVEGNRSVEDARAYYAQTIQQVMQGEQPEYVQGLQFEMQSASATADPDEPFEAGEQMAAAQAGEEGDGDVASMSADELRGKNVVSEDGDTVGEVVGVSQGEQGEQVARVELDTFLGLGAREVELPLSRLSLNADDDLQTTMSEGEIADLPDAGEEAENQ